jgi:hypothetical protein
MERKRLNRKNSGQFLIITSLVIALLLLSVVCYVFEVERKSVIQTTTSLNSYVLATKLASRNTVISSLVNVSNGGENEVLTTNLNELSSIIGNQPHFGKCNLLFTPLNSSPYQSGIWISWGSNGLGVSSAHANFTLDFTGIQADVQLEYYVNITTTLNVEGVYSKLGDTTKKVNVTCTVFNEGEPALAKNITLFYEKDGDLSVQEWIPVDSPSSTDYGNGTYFMSFIAETQTHNDPVLVSVHVHDLRDIFVQANTTCTET